jgi:hypothetical protein
MRRRYVLALVGVLVTAVALPAQADNKKSGYLTSVPAMLEAVQPQVQVTPLISVGDTLSSGYMFESIPDGIAFDTRSDGVDVYVNHETSTVPFGGAADFDNAQVSRVTLNAKSAAILGGQIVIPTDANFLRFCSNYFATEDGFGERPLLLTNEETSDLVNRTGDAYPAGPGAEQAGVVVAYDPATGEYRAIYGMGRHNHENSVALPGYDKAVVLSGDDTFSAPSSQLYMYIADDSDAVWNDEGGLWAFRGDGANDYGDLMAGSSISGSFIPVPREVATGDQTALEIWSNDNNVFQFIRVEDIAYDKNDEGVVYFADTGEPRAIPDTTTGRLKRGPSGTKGPYPNGRVFKMVLDNDDPTKVKSLSILIDGDALGADSAGVLSLIHNPDNVETTEHSLMIQEDPGGQNGYSAGDPNGTTARIWQYDLHTGKLRVVARVDQSLDAAANWGSWESSGIVDASEQFGRGSFLVNVQAHTLIVNSELATDGVTVLKREGGQMLLIKVPGA